MNARIVLAASAALVLACSFDSSKTDPATASCRPVSAACIANADCCSYGCVQGVCMPDPVQGGICKNSSDCLLGACKSGACSWAPGVCRDNGDVCDWWSQSQCCGGKCNSSGLCTVNHAPTAAVVGGDQTVPRHTIVQLDGTASSDPDGDTLIYGWSLDSKPFGSTAVLYPQTSSQPTFTADLEGTYTVTLAVTDTGGLSSSTTVHILAVNTAPVVTVGADKQASRNMLVNLSGSAVDPDGDSPLTYSWTLTAPDGAQSSLGATATTSFTPSLEGVYTATLTATDPGGKSGSASTHVTSVNVAPVARPGAAQYVNLGSTPATNPLVTLDGGASSDVNGDTFTYAWTFLSVPATSTATLSGASTSTPSFTPDLAGAYTLQLTVQDRPGSSTSANVTITTYPHIAKFIVAPSTTATHDVIAADFSRALDRLVTISSSDGTTTKNALYIWNPATETEQAVSLNKTPVCVAVSPDGLVAAVGHDAMITVVDLQNGTILGEPAVPGVTIGSIAVGNGATRYAYVAPSYSSSWTHLTSVNLSTGTVTTDSSYLDSSGPFPMRMTPSGGALYVIDNYYGTAYLRRYDVSGNVNYKWSLSKTGTYSNLWFSQDSQQLLLNSGEALTASRNVTNDLQHLGNLQNLSSVAWASFDGATTDPTIAALTTSGISQDTFSGQYYTLRATQPPAFSYWGGGTWNAQLYGAYLFDGAKRYVVVDASSHYGVVAY